MTERYIPEGFRTVTPHLHVQGAAALIDFLQKVFGSNEMSRVMRPDGTIAHAQVRIGDSMIEASDAKDRFPPMPNAIHVYVNDVDRVYKSALRAGASSLYGPVDQDYGDREAGVKDAFGNHWYIGSRIKDISK
jgi:uncharacterized glyoxalase superfamily protein PhnB